MSRVVLPGGSRILPRAVLSLSWHVGSLSTDGRGGRRFQSLQMSRQFPTCLSQTGGKFVSTFGEPHSERVGVGGL